MSTTPLSQREGYMQNISGEESAPDSAPEKSAVDDVFSEAWDKVAGAAESLADVIVNRDKPKDDAEPELLPALEGHAFDLDEIPEAAPREAKLSEKIKDPLAKHTALQADSDDFRDSQEWRDTLHRRYSGKVKLSDFMQSTVAWIERLQADPVSAANDLTETYLRMDPHVARDDAKPEGVKDDPDEHPSRKLDRILANAINGKDRSQLDRAEFKATAEIRAKLKSLFPKLTFAEALREAVKFDDDLRRDPVKASARIAATFGMPVTQHQQAKAELMPTVERARQSLKAFDSLEPRIIQYLEAPEFRQWANQYNLTPDQRLAHAHNMVLNELARRGVAA